MARPSTIIAGFTASGKTSNLMRRAIASIRDNRRIVYMDDEQSIEHVLRRMVQLGLNLRELLSLTGGIQHPSHSNLLRQVAQHSGGPFDLFLDVSDLKQYGISIDRPAIGPVKSTNADIQWLIDNAQHVYATHRSFAPHQDNRRGELVIIDCDGEHAPAVSNTDELAVLRSEENEPRA